MPPEAITSPPGSSRRTAHDAVRGGHPPVREGPTDPRPDRGVLRPVALDQRPGGPARTRDLDPRDAAGSQLAGRRPRDARSHLLHQHRDVERADDLGDPVRETGEVPVPLGLDDLLERVEVQVERVGLEGPHELGALRGSDPEPQLDGADVREDQDVGCDVPDPEGVGPLRVLEDDPGRAQGQADPPGLGGDGQVPVDGPGPVRAPGHGPDQDRGPEALPEDLGLQRHRVVIELGQCLVVESPPVEARRDAPVGDVPAQDDLDVVVLSAGGGRGVGHGRSPTPRRGRGREAGELAQPDAARPRRRVSV